MTIRCSRTTAHSAASFSASRCWRQWHSKARITSPPFPKNFATLARVAKFLHRQSWPMAVAISVSFDTIISGVDLFAPLSLEGIESIAQGIPSKDFGRSEHVFTPAYRGQDILLVTRRSGTPLPSRGGERGDHQRVGDRGDVR